MRIGIDFDNTLVDYEAVFVESARRAGLIGGDFRGDKAALRAVVRTRPDGETDWQRLQGQVYGVRMADAHPMPGAEDFLVRCAHAGHAVAIISHKTVFGHFDPSRTKLRDSARAWMDGRSAFAVARESVFFETTRADKLARIAAWAPDVFIDDLPEVFDDPSFPDGPRRVLFSPSGDGAGQNRVVCRSWAEIRTEIFRAY